MSHPPETSARAALMRDPNFRWLTAGGVVSMLGDQFTLLALPWLVLRMTGDTRVLGLVLALVSVPRAVFILAGGAIVDRHSPYRVLMLTKFVNTALLGVLALLVFTGSLTLPMVYVLALGIGLASAFSIPAATSMLPSVVRPDQLATANSIMLGLRQLSMFVGPLLAGTMIALFGDGGGVVSDAKGIGAAFALDALSFAVSAWTQSRIRMHQGAAAQAHPTSVWRSIGEGLGHIGRDPELRTCFLYWAAVAVLIMGPVHIALPVLASSQPGLGASALGLMVGAHGAGTLAGMVVSGSGLRLRLGTLGLTVLVMDAFIGLLFIPMGHVTAGWQGAGLMFSIGLLGGFMQVAIFTWMQQRVPRALMGRAMSLFMFIFMGLVPLAAAATGWLMRSISLQQLFAGCGIALVVLALVAAIASPMRRVRDPQPA
ncbi:MAG TPA: MFS transporter [Ramlibacter sp.]|nr:MFS transporter [Ramlibacter sp.]